MSLAIYFCMHTEEAFNSVFEELFPPADILVIENGFNGISSSKWEIAYDQLSKRELTPEKLRSKARYEEANFSDRVFYEKLQDRLYDPGGKTICFEHSPLTSHDWERWQKAFKNFNPHGKLKSVMIRYRGLLEMLAADQRKRKQSLSEQLRELVSRYPSYRILLIIGAGHKRVLETLIGDQIRFSSREMVTPMIGDIRSDLITKLQLGEEVTKPQLLMALAENFELEEAKKTKALRHADYIQIRQKVEGFSEQGLTEFVKKQLAKEQ